MDVDRFVRSQVDLELLAQFLPNIESVNHSRMQGIHRVGIDHTPNLELKTKNDAESTSLAHNKIR